MKHKKFFVLLLCTLMVFSALPALAQGAADPALPRVIDYADLLTSAQEAQLENAAVSVADTYGADVVILITDNIGNASAMEFADDYFDYTGYGYGAERSGALLLIAMDVHEVYISTRGSAIEAFTDYGIDLALDRIAPHLSNGAYYQGCSAFIQSAETYYHAAFVEHSPIDVGQAPKLSFFEQLIKLLPVTVIGAAVIALIRLLILRGRHKTATPQRAAGAYVQPGSLVLTRVVDQFLYTTTKRTRIETSSGGSRGGSSTHRSSSGARHGGGGRGF